MERRNKRWRRFWIVTGIGGGFSSWYNKRNMAENTTLGKWSPMF